MARDVGPLADGSSRDADAVMADVQDIHLCIELCGRRFNLNLGNEATSLQVCLDARNCVPVEHQPSFLFLCAIEVAFVRV